MESSLEDRYREHREKVQADRLALEKELISCGGEDVLLTKQRRDVLLLQPSDLLLQLRKGELSAVTVLQSYQSKALDLARSFNCITEFIPDAKAWAEALDKVAPDERRALHGLPLSVKENVMVKGLDCTLGLHKKVGQPAPVDADVVAVLKELGAVPFVKTNASQLCISPGCSNPLWGAALHPLNAARTPGGSSGGEGVLISGGGSVLGIGSDIGGSIRLPASWCGVVGIKPTAKRISRRGLYSAVRPIGIFGTSGLMGKDGAFVAEATKALFSAADFHACDPEVPPLPWNDSVYLSKKALRVGWFDSISLFPSTPGVKRAVAQAVAAFEALGHEVVAFPEQNWMEVLDIFVQLLFADQGKCTDPLLDGETVDKELLWYRSFAAVPPDQTEDRCPELQRQFGSIAVQHSFGKLSSCTDLWKKMMERSVFVNTFYQNWNSNGLDLLLCPVYPSPAPKTEQVGIITFSMVLTLMFNVMDYPAAAVPVTRQTQEDELDIANYSCTDKIHDLIKTDVTPWACLSAFNSWRCHTAKNCCAGL